jgi:AcrR family transcriptional regulator
MTYEKLSGAEREVQILAAAVTAAETYGYTRFTLQQVATIAGVDKSLPIHYFGTMVKLRRKVMRAAIKRECLAVIAQGLALRDPHAQKAPDELRQRALQSL